MSKGIDHATRRNLRALAYHFAILVEGQPAGIRLDILADWRAEIVSAREAVHIAWLLAWPDLTMPIEVDPLDKDQPSSLETIHHLLQELNRFAPEVAESMPNTDDDARFRNFCQDISMHTDKLHCISSGARD